MNKNEIYNFLSTQSNIFEILRENDFKMAREFFGEKDFCLTCGSEEVVQDDYNYWDCAQCGSKVEVSKQFEFGLETMVILKDPLAYMKNFIKE